MQDSGARYPALDDLAEAFPVHAMPLAPSSKCMEPGSFGFPLECFQSRHVSGDSVVVEVALHNAPQPGSRLWYRVMPVPHQFESYCLQLCAQPLCDRSSFHCEASTQVRSPTAMRETEKVEALGFAFPSSAPVLLGLSAKLDQTRLLRVQAQSELLHPFPQIFEELLGFMPVLESHHDVIGVANDDAVTFRLPLPPLVRPLVEGVMQVDVREQRRYHRPLRRAYLCFRPFPVLGYAGPQPFPDQALYPRVSDPVRDELLQPFMGKIVEKSLNVGVVVALAPSL